MKFGDKVKIYTDPLTEQNLEGEAKLLNNLDPEAEGELEYWKVKFLDDGFKTTRLIKRKEI